MIHEYMSDSRPITPTKIVPRIHTYTYHVFFAFYFTFFGCPNAWQLKVVVLFAHGRIAPPHIRKKLKLPDTVFSALGTIEQWLPNTSSMSPNCQPRWCLKQFWHTCFRCDCKGWTTCRSTYMFAFQARHTISDCSVCVFFQLYVEIIEQ